MEKPSSARREAPKNDPRAAWAKGFTIGYQIVTIALEIALPPLVGFYLDSKFPLLGFPIITLSALTLGLIAGTTHFIQFVKQQAPAPTDKEIRKPSKSNQSPGGPGD